MPVIYPGTVVTVGFNLTDQFDQPADADALPTAEASDGTTAIGGTVTRLALGAYSATFTAPADGVWGHETAVTFFAEYAISGTPNSILLWSGTTPPAGSVTFTGSPGIMPPSEEPVTVTFTGVNTVWTEDTELAVVSGPAGSAVGTTTYVSPTRLTAPVTAGTAEGTILLSYGMGVTASLTVLIGTGVAALPPQAVVTWNGTPAQVPVIVLPLPTVLVIEVELPDSLPGFVDLELEAAFVSAAYNEKSEPTLTVTAQGAARMVYDPAADALPPGTYLFSVWSPVVRQVVVSGQVVYQPSARSN